MGFGDNIRVLRLKNGYTQDDMAKYIGISQSVYCQYETGAKAPSVYTAVKLAQKFGTTCEQLVKDRKEQT